MSFVTILIVAYLIGVEVLEGKSIKEKINT